MSSSNAMNRPRFFRTNSCFVAILLSMLANAEIVSAQNPNVTEAAKFAGSWETDFGPMTLSVEGTIVVGTYDGENSIDGLVEGRRLVFTCREKTARGERSVLRRTETSRWNDVIVNAGFRAA
jgi:uncharacterized membrane-anchored protein